MICTTTQNELESTMNIRKKSANSGQGKSSSSLDAQQRYEHICTAAFYKACARQFVPGHEIDDWLAAEAEYDARPNLGA